MTEFRLIRDIQTSNATLGKFFYRDMHLYFTVEDVQRAIKIPGRTAIPTGRYQIIINMSNRFKKLMPLLLDVPGFSGIRIHAGNDENDTDGCIILGLARTKTGVSGSRVAVDDFMPRLEAALLCGEVWLTVETDV